MAGLRRGLRRNLEQVFAILPEGEAQRAVEATLRRLRGAAARPSPLIKWAEFTPSGRFVRAGLTSLSDHVTRLAPAPGDDPDIAAMAAEAAEGGLEPGRIQRATDGEAFLWRLPAVHAAPDRPPEPRIRVLRVDPPLFDAVVEHYNAGRGLTAAERRVAFQLVAGRSLREAAAADGVSLETRRAQAKSAAARLQCSGQTDLVRTLLGQLVHLLWATEGEAAWAGAAERFVARHLAADARLTLERLPNGRLMRCLEAGPPEGTPVVAVHGMMFGMLLGGARPWLEREGLRLLVPLRHGYLDARPLVGLLAESRNVEASLEDLALFLEVRGLAPVALLGHSLGAHAALRFAARRPGLVGPLILLSPNLASAARAGESHAGRLYGGYRTLIETGGLARAVTLEYSAHYAQEDTSRAVLSRMFPAPADIEAMEGRAAAPPVHGWFADLYASSVAGISEDYGFAMTGAAPPVPPRPGTLVLHGTRDPLTSLPTLRGAVARMPAARLREIPEAGHFAVASHPDAVWPEIAAAARGAG